MDQMSCEKSPRACEWHPLPATVASRPCLLVGGKHGRDMPAGLEQVAHYSPFSCLQRGKLWPLPLPITCRDRRINVQFFAMQDRTVHDLLGSIVDSRAHAPPKSIHRVDSEATFGRPRASIHDDSSSAQNRRPVPAPPGRSTFAVKCNLSNCSLKSATGAYQCRVPGSVKTSIQEKKAMFWISLLAQAPHRAIA